MGIGVPKEFLFFLLLTTVASLMGTSTCIEIDKKWTEPGLFWFVIASKQGTNKSGALNLLSGALTTRLRPITPGPVLSIDNNCLAIHNDFFNSLLHSIHNTQRVITCLLSRSSFSNLLECDSYLRSFCSYSMGLHSRMICPHHYQPSIDACKAWALKNC